MTAALPLDENKDLLWIGLQGYLGMATQDEYDSMVAAYHSVARLAGVAAAREELRDALNAPDLLHWLGSQDVLDVSAGVARAVSAIHRLRNVLAASPSEAQDG